MKNKTKKPLTGMIKGLVPVAAIALAGHAAAGSRASSSRGDKKRAVYLQQQAADTSTASANVFNNFATKSLSTQTPAQPHRSVNEGKILQILQQSRQQSARLSSRFHIAARDQELVGIVGKPRFSSGGCNATYTSSPGNGRGKCSNGGDNCLFTTSGTTYVSNGYPADNTCPAPTPTPVPNSAPTVSSVPGSVNAVEDTESNLDLSALVFADSDGDDLTVTLDINSGTFSAVTSAGGVTATRVSSTQVKLVGSAANINTWLDTASNLKYTGASNVSGNAAATLTISANDGTDNLASNPAVDINITAQNDAPTVSGAPASVTVTEDTESNVDLSALTFADVEGSDLTVTLDIDSGTFSAVTSAGGVTATLESATQVKLVGSAANINTWLDTASNLKYTGASNVSGNAAATLTISASDGVASLASNPAVSINITAQNDNPTGSVTISGTATQGETLTANNTLADADGLGTLSYQWKRGGSNISGATSSTYTLTQDDVGQAITVTVSYTDGGSTLESKTSNATAAVANVNDAPTGSVTISGTATQGETLTANNTLADADGLGTLSYQWKRGGSDVSGATSSSYTLTQDDVGETITVTVSYTDGGSTAESKTSDATAVVTDTNDAPTGTVTISGTATQGQTLTANNTLADADGLGALSYQWKRGGANISGATSSTYTLTQDDVGETIAVTVSYTDGGSTAESKTSNATAAVANANDAPTGDITIMGTLIEGASLTADVSGLVDLDGLGSLNYQWLSGGQAVGENQNTYTLTAADVGKAIAVRVSYVDGFGASEQISSSLTSLVGSVNLAPVFSATGNEALFVIGEPGVALFADISASPVESTQRMSGFTLAIAQTLATGAQLSFDGTAIPFNAGEQGTTETGFSYQVAVANENLVLTVSSGSVAAEVFATLLESMTYEHLASITEPFEQRVQLLSVSDDGGSFNGGQDTLVTNIDATLTVRPKVKVDKVSALVADGAYIIGDEIIIELDFDAAVTVSGSPYLALQLSDKQVNASYQGGSGSDKLTFKYTIQSGDVATQLSYVTTEPLVLNGGSIQDSDDVPVSLVLPNVGQVGSLSASSNVQIDGVLPTISAEEVSLTGATGDNASYRVGDTVTAVWQGSDASQEIAGVTVDFSAFGGGQVNAVKVDGLWQASYTITAGDLDSTNTNVVITVDYSAGNRVQITDNANATLDTKLPVIEEGQVSFNTGTGAGEAYKVGDFIQLNWQDPNPDVVNVWVDFSAAGGSSAVAASFSDGVWTAAYQVEAGDISASSQQLTLTLVDDAGNTQVFTPEATFSVNSVVPVINVEAERWVNATGLFTVINRDDVTVSDATDNEVVLTVTDGLGDEPKLAPGTHTLTWQAINAVGNIATAEQMLHIRPLINLSKDQIVAEGAQVKARVILNGDSPFYPLTVRYQVESLTADNSDHDLVSGELEINEGREAAITFNTFADDFAEGDEQFIIRILPSENALAQQQINLGSKVSQSITVSEQNIAPELTVVVTQDEQVKTWIDQSGGDVTLTASVTDANADDTHSFTWTVPEQIELADTSLTAIGFSPASLAAGAYSFNLAVTDSGSPSGSDSLQINLVIKESLPTLSDNEDSDGDGLSDREEGTGDSDLDGVPDFLDNVALAANVLAHKASQSDTFILETEPGTKATLGQFSLQGGNGGALLPEEGLIQLDDTDQNSGGVFDFEVKELPVRGQTVEIVIPQLAPIPADGVYRKLTPSNGWVDFVEDANNSIYSATGAMGFCPPPGDVAYTSGLTEGHWCVSLRIEDGGPNDADGVANNAVVDPGGIMVRKSEPEEETPTSSGGGGSTGWLSIFALGWLWLRRVTKGNQ
ncbi:choice-of-anchor U domain-containing protein [Motilimonas sp. KMU-193]|uniref:choice-of-anchor U domain-containing protein n=1 Tax=Motilimonas sp. KMU-193 TaxID=3388668 RepID=UPI00396B1C1C